MSIFDTSAFDRIVAPQGIKTGTASVDWQSIMAKHAVGQRTTTTITAHNTMNAEFKKVDNGYIVRITMPGQAPSREVVLVAKDLREAADLVVAHAVAERLE